MNCQKCGKELREDWAFCGACGHKVDTDIASSVQPTIDLGDSYSNVGNTVRPEFKPSAALVKVSGAHVAIEPMKVRGIVGVCLMLFFAVLICGTSFFLKHCSSSDDSYEIVTADEQNIQEPNLVAEAETDTDTTVSESQGTDQEIPWNTADENIQTNGNGKLAFNLVKQQKCLAKIAVPVEPYAFFQSPGKYIGKPIALTLRASSFKPVKCLPEVTTEGLGRLVLVGKHQEIVNTIMIGDYEQILLGEDYTVFGYYVGRKSGGYQLVGRCK